MDNKYQSKEHERKSPISDDGKDKLNLPKNESDCDEVACNLVLDVNSENDED